MDIETLLKHAPPLGTPDRAEWNRSLGADIDTMLRAVRIQVRLARKMALSVRGRPQGPHQDRSQAPDGS